MFMRKMKLGLLPDIAMLAMVLQIIVPLFCCSNLPGETNLHGTWSSVLDSLCSNDSNDNNRSPHDAQHDCRTCTTHNTADLYAEPSEKPTFLVTSVHTALHTVQNTPYPHNTYNTPYKRGPPTA